MVKIIFLRNNMTQPAFSDQELREKTIELVQKFNISKIYETGTYHGGSVNILSKLFPQVQITTYEINEEFLQIARGINAINSNVTIRNINSPEGLKNDLKEGEENILLFLDAHWYNYWPILDELAVIKEKQIKPSIIIIHDFFVPDGAGRSKFPFDSYHGQPLDMPYIEKSLKEIYGENGYEYEYATKTDISTGVVYITRKQI